MTVWVIVNRKCRIVFHYTNYNKITLKPATFFESFSLCFVSLLSTDLFNCKKKNDIESLLISCLHFMLNSPLRY